MINYRSLTELNRNVFSWLDILPHDFDVIVGVPRSGLLVANLLSTQTNTPMTDLKGLLERRMIDSGQRLQIQGAEGFFNSRLKVLVVDDSVGQGKQIQKAKKMIEEANAQHEILFGALYVTPECKEMVDFYFEVLPLPRVFEWNILNNNHLKWCCVDIDGILCRDPTKEENDDGLIYESFIKNVNPKFVPNKKIGWLVTSRLEKYRMTTEMWLKNNSIKYDYLRMLDLPDINARIESQAHATHKAAVYQEVWAKLFIESSRKQADRIAYLTGKPVYCIETSEMIFPYRIRRIQRRVQYIFMMALTNPGDFLRKVRRRAFGR